MKKFISILTLILLSYVSVHAETVEVFVCKPKKTSQKHQAKNNYNFMLVSTNSEIQKYVTYDLEDNVAMAWIYTEKYLKEKMGVKGYKSYSEWTTYEYNIWDYFPKEYTVTNYIMTERKKDGRLILSGTVLTTSEYYFNKFSELEKLRNEHKNEEEKYFKMFKKNTSEIYKHFEQRWGDSQNVSSSVKRALLAWDCNKA